MSGGKMVPGERFELPTNGLQNRCSTAELTRQIKHLVRLLALVCERIATEWLCADVGQPPGRRQRGRSCFVGPGLNSPS
jgi:hypothetical protein